MRANRVRRGFRRKWPWRRTVATIRMQLQVFSVFCESAHGVTRFGQHSHSSRRGSGDGRDPVEPARAAVRRAAAAGVSADRHGGGQFRAGPDRVQRRAYHLSGGIGGAGVDPVRRRPADPVSKHPRRAGAVDGAGDHRRAADGADHRAGRQIRPRPELGRGAAGRRRGGVDRRRGGVSAGARAGPAAASARRRDARGRVRYQRSVRGVSHADAGGTDLERCQLVLACGDGIRAGGGARRHHRRGRWTRSWSSR